MEELRKFRSLFAWPLIAAMLAFSMPLGAAQAALVGTDRVIEQTEIAADRGRIEAFFAREDVQRQLAARGVDADEAAARVASLSDAEIARIAERIDAMPAGQGAVGSIVGAALVVFLVLLITDLLGYTDIFPFIKKTIR